MILYDTGDGITKDLQCAHPISGRFVFIQMVGIEASLSLCEVLVFTEREFSGDRCGTVLDGPNGPHSLTSFNETCYEFATQQGGSYGQAEQYCRSRGGALVHSVQEVTHNFLYNELERLKNRLKAKLVWLGAKREPNPNGLVAQGDRGDRGGNAGLSPMGGMGQNIPSFHRSRSAFWYWNTGELVTRFLWADDQPNNYNGQQNCIVLDGGRKWLWNDVTCDLDYLPWICQYRPSHCGSPDKKENSTIIERDFRVGRSITYRCPLGWAVVGAESSRACLPTGFWNGTAPSCKYVDCGSLGTGLENGHIHYANGSRTDYNSTAVYLCDDNFTLVGARSRTCQENGTWSHSDNVGKCLYKWCPLLTPIPNAVLNVTNRTENGLAHYSCHVGHKLLGNGTRQCLLGGKWTGEEPYCKFIDCGLPLDIRNGRFVLLNGTTTYESMVQYRCLENYALNGGNETRNCTAGGTWSGVEPACKRKLIIISLSDTNCYINDFLMIDKSKYVALDIYNL